MRLTSTFQGRSPVGSSLAGWLAYLGVLRDARELLISFRYRWIG